MRNRMIRTSGLEPVCVSPVVPLAPVQVDPEREVGDTIGQCASCGGDVIVIRQAPLPGEASTVCVACCKLDPACKMPVIGVAA
jgi:hypothetical protein